MTASADAPFRVVFVCSGNICRSPMADVVFRRMADTAGLGSRVVSTSAGTGDWHVGERADHRTLAAIPLYILTLGLISLVINGFLLWLTGIITENWDWGLRTGEFWLTVVAALLIGIINAILGGLFRPRRDDRSHR